MPFASLDRKMSEQGRNSSLLNGYKFLHRGTSTARASSSDCENTVAEAPSRGNRIKYINEGNATFLFMLIFLVKKYNVGTSLLYSQLILGRLKSALTSFNSWNHEVSIGNYFKYYNEIDHR